MAMKRSSCPVGSGRIGFGYSRVGPNMIAVPHWRCRYVGSGGRSVVAAVFGGEAAPVMVSGEAACTCLEGKPATWAEDITKTARSSPYVVSLLHVSAPSAVSLPA